MFIPLRLKLAFVLAAGVAVAVALFGLMVENKGREMVYAQASVLGKTLGTVASTSSKIPILRGDGNSLKKLSNDLVVEGGSTMAAGIRSVEGENLGWAVSGQLVQLRDAVRITGVPSPIDLDGITQAEFDRRLNEARRDGGDGALLEQVEQLKKGLFEALVPQQWPEQGVEVVHEREVSLIRAPVTFGPSNKVIGWVWIAMGHHALEEGLIKVRWQTILIGLVLVGVMTTIAIVLGGRISSRIEELDQATQAIAQGKLDTRLEPMTRKDEVEDLVSHFNQMAADIESRERLREAFGRFVHPHMADAVARGDWDLNREGHRVDATILFIDLVGFTSMSESIPEEEVVQILNAFFDKVVEVVFRHNGSIDKFIGDAAMAVFGVPVADDNHLYNGCQAALELLEVVDALQLERSVQVRIGLNSGSVVEGAMGAADRLDYTVVGDVVNVASRLCDEAPTGGILVPEALKQPWMTLGERHQLSLHGKRDIQTAAELIGIRGGVA